MCGTGGPPVGFDLAENEASGEAREIALVDNVLEPPSHHFFDAQIAHTMPIGSKHVRPNPIRIPGKNPRQRYLSLSQIASAPIPIRTAPVVHRIVSR